MSEDVRRSIDPLVSYAFRVAIGNEVVARFSGVDGLSYEVEMIEYRDSASPNTVQYRQGRRKPVRVTLKKGLLTGGAGDKLFQWIRACEAGEITPEQVTISIGNYGVGTGIDETGGNAMKSWVLENARPVKWSLSSLEGGSNNPVIETIELTAERLSNGSGK